MVTLKTSSPLHAEVMRHATEVVLTENGDVPEGVVVARETRNGDAWLVVEFPGYGTVILPATDFDEV